jgi:hypothetical protein
VLPIHIETGGQMKYSDVSGNGKTAHLLRSGR